MPVITISRDAGSFGDEIAVHLADELKYKLLDPEGIKVILSSKGIKKPVIEQFDEKNPGFFSKFSENKDKFLNYLSLSVFEESFSDGLVVLGLGGQFLFSSQKAVVRVRVTAPENLRIARVAEKYECDESYAGKLIHQVDHDREGFEKDFFGRDLHDVNAYDLNINTEYISIDNAVKMIRDVCKFKNKLIFNFKDDYITQKAMINILYEKKIPVKNLHIHFEKGVLTLEGKTGSTEDSELSVKAVQDIDGVEEVRNKISHKVLNNYSVH